MNNNRFSLFLQLHIKKSMPVEHSAMKTVPHHKLRTVTFSLLPSRPSIPYL